MCQKCINENPSAFERQLRKELEMDEYQTRHDINEFYVAKRKAEDRRFYGIIARLGILAFWGLVAWFVFRNPYQP